MKKLIIKNEGRDVVAIIPENWDELKVKHFLCLESTFEEVDFISAFMDVPKKDIENITGNLGPVIETIQSLFHQKPPDFSKAKKKILTMEGKQIKFPNSLDFTRYGQKSMLKNILLKETGIEQEISTIFAIYAQPLIDGKFNSQRIPEVKKLVDEMPIIEVYPYVLFFFKRSNELRRHLHASVAVFPKIPSSLNMKF